MTMTAAERTRADAEALLDSIRRDWQELASGSKSAIERKGVRTHMMWAMGELAGLFEELNNENA